MTCVFIHYTLNDNNKKKKKPKWMKRLQRLHGLTLVLTNVGPIGQDSGLNNSEGFIRILQ